MDMTFKKAEEVCRQFDISGIISVEPTDIGHINSTHIVHTEKGKFVMQRLHGGLSASKLEHNYLIYSKAFDEHDWLYPVWRKTVRDGYFYTDEEGFDWRIYPFIEGEILRTSLTKEELYACGRGLAKMHMIFGTIQDEPLAVYPNLHDLAYHYERYMRAICAGETESGGRARDGAVEEIIAADISVMLEKKSIETSIVHGDTKISNLLFGNGNVVGCLDLDTFMKGSLREDLADCIRSCCTGNGRFDRTAAGHVVSGYAGSFDAGLFGEDPCDEKMLPGVFDKICFELGLRYYTDFISDERHFDEKYPGYRLVRAKSLLSLRWSE